MTPAQIRMLGERAVRELVQHPVRARKNRLIVLPDDDLAFGDEVRLVDGEVRHAIRLGPQQPLEVVRRHDLIVVGDVLGGVRVVIAADVLGEPVHRLGLHVRGPLEHEMLEEVREPRPPRGIALRPNVISNVDGHGRRPMILGNDDPQPIGQRPLRKSNGRDDDGRLLRRAGRRRSEHPEHRKPEHTTKSMHSSVLRDPPPRPLARAAPQGAPRPLVRFRRARVRYRRWKRRSKNCARSRTRAQRS